MTKRILIITFLLLMVNFAQAAKPGTITLKINPALVQVNLGEGDVAVGDRVVIYKKICSGGRTQTCKKKRVGEGSVARVLNEKYSEIKLDAGVHASEGFLIERE